MKEYPEVHQYGIISIENKEMILNEDYWYSETKHGDFGIQIAEDGRVWICIDGIAFIRFKPLKKKEQK